MAASEQLVVMYTAGYLQIQHIVERGMDLMFKANSPHCDSQTAGSLEETGSEPQSPSNNGNGLAVAALLGTPGWSPSLLMPQRKIKLEVGDLTPVTIPSAQSKTSASELGNRFVRASSLFYSTAGGIPIPGMPSYHHQGASGVAAGGGVERSSPGSSSLPTTDSPTSYQNEDEEFEEEPYDGITEDTYSNLYGRLVNPYGSEYFISDVGLPPCEEQYCFYQVFCCSFLETRRVLHFDFTACPIRFSSTPTNVTLFFFFTFFCTLHKTLVQKNLANAQMLTHHFLSL